MCDVAESCNGASNDCPADAKQTNGTLCDLGDAISCSIADSCQAGICILGGGGDANGNHICDADDSLSPIVIDRALLTTGRPSRADNGRVRISGHIDDTAAGDLSDRLLGGGFAFRVTDGDKSFDATVDVGSCRLRHGGEVVCAGSGPVTSNSEFIPEGPSPTIWTFRLVARGLPDAVTGPVSKPNPMASPATVEFLHNGIGDSDTIAHCRQVYHSTLNCHW